MLCFMVRYPVVYRRKVTDMRKYNSRRASKMHDRIVCQKTMRSRAVRFLKGSATIGVVRRGRDARFEPRAADEACTAHVNANKF